MAERSRKADILHAATSLFKEKGYHGTTIRDIAEMSGMLSGSLYAHIKTKEDLLFEITNEVADQFLFRIHKVVISRELPVEKFRLALLAHIEVVRDHLDAASVFSHEWKALTADRRAIIQKKRDKYEESWAQIIDEGISRGDFHAEGARFSRVVALSVANWLYQWYHPDGPMNASQVSQELAGVLLRGLRRDRDSRQE